MKHIMCFSDFSFRNTFCVSVGKTLWKSQNVSLNGFFQGKHHLAPAVLVVVRNFEIKQKKTSLGGLPCHCCCCCCCCREVARPSLLSWHGKVCGGGSGGDGDGDGDGGDRMALPASAL